ncbi:MAG: hypothetical protein ACRCTE_04170 [Cellulosilyticaceae bacterium]
MIDFEKELEKYKPVLEINNIESELTNYDLRDIVDLIKNIVNENK